MTTLLNKTAAMLALIDDHAFQGVPKGMITCFGSTEKQRLIDEMIASGIVQRRNPELNYGVRFYELTEAGQKWDAERRCFP
jgi:hypothetical protein